MGLVYKPPSHQSPASLLTNHAADKLSLLFLGDLQVLTCVVSIWATGWQFRWISCGCPVPGCL